MSALFTEKTLQRNARLPHPNTCNTRRSIGERIMDVDNPKSAARVRGAGEFDGFARRRHVSIHEVCLLMSLCHNFTSRIRTLSI
jgi:hypothetical protein